MGHRELVTDAEVLPTIHLIRSLRRHSVLVEDEPPSQHLQLLDEHAPRLDSVVMPFVEHCLKLVIAANRPKKKKAMLFEFAKNIYTYTKKRWIKPEHLTDREHFHCLETNQTD